MGTAYNDTEGTIVVDGVRSRRPTVSSSELRVLDGATLSTDELNLLDGATVSTAELNYLDLATLGTGAASKAVVLDGSGDYTYPAAATIVHPSGATEEHASGSTVNIAGTFQIAGAAVTSSAAEMNKVDDSVEDVYADGIGLLRIAKATYDFAVDGGAISAIDLGVTIPANSIILGGFVDVQTTCQSTDGGTDLGSGALSVEGTNDIVSAVTIVAAADWDQGLRPIIPTGVAGTAVKTTSASTITFTIAVAAFTAGKFTVLLIYLPTIAN